VVSEHLARYSLPDDDALLFTAAKASPGQPLRADVLRTAFKRAANRIGQPDLTFHSLRHGYASELSDMGIPLRDIQAGGGWSTLAMVNHYAKPLDHALVRIVERQEARDLG
jgi:integrase